MSQLKQTDDGDLAIENNRFSLVTGTDEIRQRLIQNLKTFLAEWFLDNTIGIPYFQVVFDKNSPPNLINDVFKDAILKTKGVVEIVEWTPLDLNSKTRELTVDFSYRDEFSTGSIPFNEVI